MATSTNQKPTMYRNLYENTDPCSYGNLHTRHLIHLCTLVVCVCVCVGGGGEGVMITLNHRQCMHSDSSVKFVVHSDKKIGKL